MSDELLALMREKLSALEKALILETDAGVKFKLKYEILNLKQQLAGYDPAFSQSAFPSNTSSQPATNANNSTANTPKQDEIFISYAWSGESERIVNELDKRLLEKGLTVIRDKRDLGFKGNIKEFMQRMGQGHYVIVVISDKYLKSHNCMFELLEIAQKGDFYDRIFPIVLADADIYDPITYLDYVAYWNGNIRELETKIKEVGVANVHGVTERLELYMDIRKMFDRLISVIGNMNTLTPEMHEAGNFEQLYQAIEDRRAQDR